jgi:uncharacterized protein YqjF (DUF2071 family)
MARNVDSVIERRLLVNYRITPERVAALLPAPFRPQLVNDHAVGGVCFIRLTGTRLRHLPRAAGLASENVAHRFAVEWDDAGGSRTGVYVPRRETSSRLTATLGDRVFPGAYHLARFQVAESGDMMRIDVRSLDGEVSLSATTIEADTFTSGLFPTLDAASRFFREGCLGFTPAAGGRLDEVRLRAATWAVRPVTIAQMRSSVFDDAVRFPPGTCTLDSALLMSNIAARWTTDPRAAFASAWT